MRILRVEAEASEDLVEISTSLDALTGSSREELGPGYRSVVAARYIIY